jgi:ribonuclease-3
MSIGKEIIALQDAIGYEFSDIAYLENALTHSSYSNEQKSRGILLESNERLEFLGDAVLQSVISKYLYKNYKKYTEGTLTKMRQYLVCEKTLSKIAAEINLGDYLNLGKGEETNGCRQRPKVLADALEAVFAAVYLDSVDNPSVHESVLLELFSDTLSGLDDSFEGDYKTMLQQLVEKDGASELVYKVISEEGPEHNKRFTVVALINNNEVGRGKAKNKKDAEMQAAKVALKLFGIV